jgi:hypothetical protein
MADLQAYLDQNETLRKLYNAAELVSDEDHDSSEPEFDAALAILQDCVEGFVSKEAIDIAFLRACSDFTTSWKLVRFGILKASDTKAKLTTAILDYDSAISESNEKIDPLSSILYVVTIAQDGKEPRFVSQPFKGGRPINAEIKHDSRVAVAMAATRYGLKIVEVDEQPKPYLYILMRNDIGSMNPGKAVAQGTHAANQMIFDAMIATDPLAQVLEPERATVLAHMVATWTREARGFGTCIVLGASEKQMRASVASATAARLHAGITHDPSYPVRDGGAFYTIPMDTCAYIFDYPVLVRPHVSDLSLLP